MPVRRGRQKREDSRHVAQAARLAALLRSRRESAGITQESLATAASVCISTVRKIESGAVVEPGYFTVLALMSALGISSADLGGTLAQTTGDKPSMVVESLARSQRRRARGSARPAAM